MINFVKKLLFYMKNGQMAHRIGKHDNQRGDGGARGQTTSVENDEPQGFSFERLRDGQVTKNNSTGSYT